MCIATPNIPLLLLSLFMWYAWLAAYLFIPRTPASIRRWRYGAVGLPAFMMGLILGDLLRHLYLWAAS